MTELRIDFNTYRMVGLWATTLNQTNPSPAAALGEILDITSTLLSMEDSGIAFRLVGTAEDGTITQDDRHKPSRVMSRILLGESVDRTLAVRVGRETYESAKQVNQKLADLTQSRIPWAFFDSYDPSAAVCTAVRYVTDLRLALALPMQPGHKLALESATSDCAAYRPCQIAGLTP